MVYTHLMAAEDLLGAQRSPVAGKAIHYIEEAQEHLEEKIYSFPRWGHYPLVSPGYHLRSAYALVGEHLEDAPDAERTKVAVERALEQIGP